MLVLPIVLVVLTLAGRLTESAETGVNAGEFQALCRFVKFLKAPMKFPEIRIGNKLIEPTQSAVDDLNRIGELLLATTDDHTFFQLTKNPNTEKNNTFTADGLTKEDWEKIASAWHAKQTIPDESNPTPLRPPPGGQRERARSRIARIYHAAKDILKQITEKESQVKKLVYETRKFELAAVYGLAAVEGEEEKDRTLGDEAKTALIEKTDIVAASFSGQSSDLHEHLCGSGVAPEEHAGYALVNDLACVCAAKASPERQNYCGKHLNLGSETDWSTTGKVVNIAKAVLKECPGINDKAEPESIGSAPEKLMNIVSQLHGMLGKGAILDHSGGILTGSSNKKESQFILGAHAVYANAAVKCDGSTGTNWNVGTNGICINYSHHLDRGNEIPWVKSVIKAAVKAKEAEDEFNLISPLLARLGILRGNVEIYYELAFEAQVESSGSLKLNGTVSKENVATTPLANGGNELPTSGTQSKLGACLLLASALYNFAAH